jgi:regulator of RNase E activity RraA
LTDWNVSIRIGSIEIRPGDVLVGDLNGVVCVPKDDRETVLEQAEAMAKREDDVRAAIRDGVDPVTAYEKFGEF